MQRYFLALLFSPIKPDRRLERGWRPARDCDAAGGGTRSLFAGGLSGNSMMIVAMGLAAPKAGCAFRRYGAPQVDTIQLDFGSPCQ